MDSLVETPLSGSEEKALIQRPACMDGNVFPIEKY